MIQSDLPKELMDIQEEVLSYVKGYGLDCFDTVFELIESKQINAIAAGGGFPKRYPHWRIGMAYDQLSKGHTWGFQKIYELVINTNPCYAYLVSSNSNLDQKLVMAHVYGHCDFFKNNVWFSKTNRKMLDQMANHAVRIRRYIDEHGEDVVEKFIDICLSLENLIDPYSLFTPKKDTKAEDMDTEEPPKLKSPRSYLEHYMNPKEFIEEQKKIQKENRGKTKKFPPHPERDVLLFLLENAPLESWQQEILFIIREESYYFSPQAMTKIMNEGWASYWHSKILTEKALKPNEFIDFAERHSSVVATQPGQLNPYKLGIELFRHIEDVWNKGKFGREYEECDDMKIKKAWDKKLGKGREKIFEVRKRHNDITFIDEFFTEDFCEEQRFYTYEKNQRTNNYEIKTRDWKKVKEEMLLSFSNAGNPIIEIIDGNYLNRGELLLKHIHAGKDLDLQHTKDTLKNLSLIWNRPVCINTKINGEEKVFRCDPKTGFQEERA